MRDYWRSRFGGSAIGPSVLMIMTTVLALGVLTLGVGGCSESSSGSSDSGAGGGAQTDSSLRVFAEAQASVSKAAKDVIVFSAGTPGLAFADVPDSWAHSFYSPGDNHIYRVAVNHGTAETAEDMAAAQKGVEVTQAVDITSIKVGAVDAVVKARVIGEKSGKVPINVSVVGIFAETSNDAALTLKPGVWRVMFATGTDAADAQTFDVAMMTGDVTAVED